MWSDALLFLCMLLHLFSAPYTKVEESFNVQAVHDLLFTPELDQYDHLEFSGVVPRTFVGPVVLAVCAAPFKWMFEQQQMHKEQLLIVARFFLGTFFLLSYSFLRRSFAHRFHQSGAGRIEWLGALLTVCQFHVLFYSSRPLANTFAAVLVNVALGYFTLSSSLPSSSTPSKDKQTLLSPGGAAIAWLAVACILFRCDMLILAVCIIAALFIHRWISISDFFKFGLVASAVAVVASVLLDSYYWRRWLWPEFEVLFFNTLKRDENGQMFTASSAWGTEPFHWYFAKAIPKALSGTLFFIPFSLWKRVPKSLTEIRANPRMLVEFDTAAIRLLYPSLLFVLIYSNLSHKELRFIYPILPYLTCFAALGASKIIDAFLLSQQGADKKENKSTPAIFTLTRFLILVGIGALAVSLASSTLSLYVSSLNYPGGYAMRQFHQLQCQSNSTVKPLTHICNLAATSGVSRFGEHPTCMRYSKQEHLREDQYQNMDFDFLIAESQTIPGFRLMEPHAVSTISAYNKIFFAGLRAFPFLLRIETTPQLFLLQRIPPAQQV